MSEEATINPDGTQTFPNPTASDAGTEEDAGIPEEDNTADETILDNDESTGGIDPAIYLALAAIVFAILFIVMRRRRKRATADVDDFFSNLDGEKVSFSSSSIVIVLLPVLLFVGGPKKLTLLLHATISHTHALV